jgi:hypothetical protein
MLRHLVAVVALLMLVTACGDEEDDAEPTASKPNPQSAALATQQTVMAVSSLTGPGATGPNAAMLGLSAVNVLGGVGEQTQNMVQPDFGFGNDDDEATDSKKASIGALVHLSSVRPLTTPPGYTGTCECTETSCTFTACKGQNQQLTLDGTYSWGGGKLKATGLKFTMSSANTAGETSITTDATWTIDCDMTISPTAIDGTFRTNGSSKQAVTRQGGPNQNVDASWNTTLTFKQVAFVANTAPTGGSTHVSSTVNATVNGSAYKYGGDFDVTFPYQP